MPKIDKTIIQNKLPNIKLGDLNIDIITTSDKNGIDKDIFIENYGENEKILTICFTYNNDLEENINNFKLKFKEGDLFEGSVLIVGGGGGGGYNIGGGGGGGEVIYIDNVSFKKNIEYNIVVGKGGKKGENNYYNGDSGYNSGLNDILACGGGGGASYIYDTPYNLLNKDNNDFGYANDDGKGLDGGSGGGGCGLQYNNCESNCESNYVYGKKKSLKNSITAFDNYYSFGNNGGVGNSYIKEDDLLLNVRGGGGGGAGEVGDNSTDVTNREYGKGGDGISIEEIDIKTGNIVFCPLLYNRLGNKQECIEKEIKQPVTNTIIKKLRTEINHDSNISYLYWGGGGGSGSFNIKAGNGGKGGGGGGGYYEEQHPDPQDNFVGNIIDNSYIIFNNNINREDHNGKSSAEELSQLNDDKNIAKGGRGIDHTGGGGGGGGLSSEGGNGGSGIVILMLKTTEKKIVVKEQEYTLTDIEKMLSEFDKNKKDLGKNISEMYNYNIREHREFYDYIDRIYEDDVIVKNIPHEKIKDVDNKKRKDIELLKYNYDRDIYDIKFHQYLKIIFDLKINYDSFLLYTKIKNENTFGVNNKLFDYQRLIIMIIDIIEDIIILIRNDTNYHELINNVDVLEIELLNKERKQYNLKEDLSELDKDIELIENQLYITNSKLYNLKKKEQEGENTKREQEKLKTSIINLEVLIKNKKDDKGVILEKDLYYRYSEIFVENKKQKVMKFYVSNNNNFEVYNDIINENENILKNEIFDHYKINNINLKEILNYKNVKELIKGEYLEDNDMQLFIKIYIYSLLKIKKQNFLKNILSIYIYINVVNILQNFYKESEIFLLGNNITNYENENELYICKTVLYKNLQSFNNVVLKMKSLLGYSFINEYINDYKINNAKIISTSCPYVKIQLNDYDSNTIILMLFRKTKNDDILLNCNDLDTECNLKEKINLLKYKDYYENLKESFLIEIEKNRYSIHDFNFIKKNMDNGKIVDIIEFIIDDRYNKICKNSEVKDIKNIYIQAKDSSHINDIYDTDVELLDKFNTKIQKQKTDLDNINEKYGKYKYHFEKLKFKNNIYYFLLFLILIFIIILNIADISSYIKSVTYLICLSVLAILVIYNYFTKVNLNIIEKYSNNENDRKIFYDYYNISKVKVESSETSTYGEDGYYNIKLKLYDEDKYKLKIRKFKNLDKNNENYVNNLIIKHLRIFYDKGIKKIINVDINDDDIHYYYINAIVFEHNIDVETDKDIEDVGLLKNDETIIKKLITDINNYETISITERENLCNALSLDITTRTEENIKENNDKKLIYIYTVRNDLLRYINNKFININKVIESIELEKANNLSNKVHKSLTNEKKNLIHYQKEYENKKIKNINVNNLYKHEILYQSTFINFVIIFSLILVLLLLLCNIFPSQIIFILSIGFVLISVNIYNYILNTSYPTRKDANKKYW